MTRCPVWKASFFIGGRLNEVQDEGSHYEMKIGNTTFIVYVKQADSASKSLETVFRELCEQEVMSGGEAALTTKLDENTKIC